MFWMNQAWLEQLAIIDHNFYMSRNNILNVPSLEELSFKLSEQHLPSLSSKPLIPSV